MCVSVNETTAALYVNDAERVCVLVEHIQQPTYPIVAVPSRLPQRCGDISKATNTRHHSLYSLQENRVAASLQRSCVGAGGGVDAMGALAVEKASIVRSLLFVIAFAHHMLGVVALRFAFFPLPAFVVGHTDVVFLSRLRQPPRFSGIT
jgi:hypothetical protein